LKGKSYVGVSGISSVREAEEVVDAFYTDAGFSAMGSHVPMMGFQVSYKCLERGYSEGNNRVPMLDELPNILKAVEGKVFSTVHYYTKNKDSLLKEVWKVLNTESIYYRVLVGGLQINGVLPTPEQFGSIKHAFPELKLILQLSPKTVGTMHVNDIAKSLSNDYAGVDYVLIDPSMGTGKEFDVNVAVETYHMLRTNCISAGIVFAGGLNGSNVSSKVRSVSKAIGTTEFSIDAEGGLRDRLGDGYGNDALNMEKVRAYLRNARAALSVAEH
jgi:phosphoribosylanthranilate isomerase